MWDWDVASDSMTVDASIARAYGITGLRIEHGARALCTSVVHPDDVTEFTAVIDDALANGRHISHRHRAIFANGALRHVQFHAHVTRDSAGTATRVLGVTIDVTSEVERSDHLRLRAEEERRLRDRLNLATQTAGIGVWDMDLTTRAIEADPQTLRILGAEHGLHEALLPQLLPPEESERVCAQMHAAVYGSVDNLMSVRHAIRRLDDRALRHIQTHVRIFRDGRGAPLRLLGVTWDVTEEVEHAAQLRAQTEHVRMLLDRLSVASKAAGISAWEIEVPSGKMMWVENRTKAFGLDDVPLEEYLERLRKLIDPSDLAQIDTGVRQAIDNGQRNYSCRFRIQRADGTLRHLHYYVHIVRDETGKALRLLGATSDVTNEVQTTHLLQQQAARLSMATDAASICSWEIDLQANRFLWTENWLAALGTARPDPTANMDVFTAARVHPDDRALFAASIAEAQRTKSERFSLRHRALGEQGNIVHVQSHVRLMHDDDGATASLLGVSWDVTREVEAAQKLEQQSVQQRLLLERLSVATQVADISSWELDLTIPEFRWIENPIKALVHPGDDRYTVQSLLARTHPEDRTCLAREIANAMRTGTDRVSYRYRGLAHDGATVHVQNFVKLFYDDEGNAVTALGASWNITAEIEAANRLEQQAEQLRLAEGRLERASLSSSEGHWEADVRTGRTWLSSSYHALLGYSEGSLPTDTEALELLTHPDDRQAPREAINHHVATGAPYYADIRLKCANGEYRWFRQRGMAERDDSGTVVLMSGSIHDIHEQKLAENALQLAQRRFERAINGTQDGLWELEANGDAWCSPRLIELLGYAPNELPSQTNFLRDHLHPEDTERLARATQAHFQCEQPYDVEIRLRTKSGDYRWYRARAAAERDAHGQPLRMSGSLQDVTEARAAREALVKATAAAEAASRAKSFFLANVSHEIRTPMNGIIGMTGLLLDTALDRTQRDFAETIRTSADSLLIVINDILDFSKIEAGKLDIEAIELDLRGNVEDVGGMMAFQAAAKNLELVVHVHPDVPDRVVGDPQRIRQCLINLVGNAIKFTREGEIVIEVSTVGRRDGKVLTRFEVRDTGIGIAADTLQTLFEPFVQADASTTRHFGGTGLGLSIVRRLVEMMNGAVGIESELGKGSSFWFTLPLDEAANGRAGPIELHRLGRRVLIVDDHETNRRVLAGQLMHAGYEVSLAKTGQEALQLLRQGRADNHPYDIVLADYQMEDMDGAALGERVNADPHLSSARIVILTSLDRHGDIRRFASLGFAGYLTKPVRARELFECLDRVLAREAKEWHLQSQPMVTRGTLIGTEPQHRYAGHVLLVEDNPVNQKVAVRYLERMGCRVRVADNGAEGVKACREGRFDLILMDLQMPVMDGLTATRCIRELTGGAHTTPIVALTANAMSGQLERCMEAGMNGFLTKPLEIARLHETLETYGLAVQAGPGTATGAKAVGAPIDLARLHEITDGDPEFTHELAATFVASGEQVLSEIHHALETLDRPALGRAAHKLKGASANIHAEPLRELAYAVETHATDLDQQRLRELVNDLRKAFATAAEFLKEQAPPPAAKAG